LPAPPEALLAAGKVNPVHVALGANTNDSFLFISTQGPLSRKAYLEGLTAEADGNHSLAQRLVQLYPPKPSWSADNIDRKGWYSADRMLCGYRRTAERLSQSLPGGHAYLYRYNYWYQSNASCTAVANYHEPYYGSMHQDEVSFVFGQPIFMNLGFTNCSVPGWAGFDPSCLGCAFDARESGFSNTMGRLWTSFAADRPSEWPKFGASGGKNVLLEPSKLWLPGVRQIMRTETKMGRPERCALWDEITDTEEHARAHRTPSAIDERERADLEEGAQVQVAAEVEY